jgi:cytochrome b6-f complex iron-sulfur subunit
MKTESAQVKTQRRKPSEVHQTHPNRRQVVQTIAVTAGSIALLGACAPSVVKSGKREKIADLSSLNSDGQSVQFKYDNVQAVLVRTGKTLRTTEFSSVALVAYSMTCTHLGCVVNKPEASGQTVCGCHGSRFAADGSVIDGPASRPLESIKLEVVDGAVFAVGWIDAK